MATSQQTRVGWIGLGAMGSGMAASLVEQGFSVKAFDVYPPSLEVVVKKGAIPAASPVEAARDVSVLALMVVNAKQVEDIIFGTHQVAHVLQPGASIICFSTVPPSFLITVQERLDALGTGIGICDSPVSGGSTRAAQGTLTIMTSGTAQALSTAQTVLDGLTRKPEGKLSVVGSAVGIASDFKLINQVCCACQIAMASESMAFGTKLGLNPRMLYNAIRTASGDSFMFGHRVPQQFKHSGVIASAMAIVTKDIGIVMDEARLGGFQAPVSAAVEQLFTTAAGAGMARTDDGLLIKLWEKFGGASPEDKGSQEEEVEKAKELAIEPSGAPRKVLFVGLGAMGAGMATAVQASGIPVVGHDVSLEAMDRFAAAGGKVSSDAVQEATDADVVVLMPVTAAQAEAALFGSAGQAGLASALPNQAVIILGSTVGPTACVRIQAALDQLNKGLQLVDAPVSGGPARAAPGDLAIMASGETAALQRAASTLHAMSTQAGRTQNLHFIPGGVGSGQKVKLVNNLLAGVHLAVAAEAFAFAQKKGMDLDAVFGVLSNGAAYTYVMTDRFPRMRMANPPVHSALDTFVKDLSIVLTEAKAMDLPLFLGAAAHQQFIAASAIGLGKEDDSAIARLWEAYGVRVRAA